jgi:hypothetical protein
LSLSFYNNSEITEKESHGARHITSLLLRSWTLADSSRTECVRIPPGSPDLDQITGRKERVIVGPKVSALPGNPDYQSRIMEGIFYIQPILSPSNYHAGHNLGLCVTLLEDRILILGMGMILLHAITTNHALVSSSTLSMGFCVESTEF